MSVIDKKTIDSIAVTNDDEGIILLITDHLEWKDEYNHLVILQEKINAYISFLESGQYKEIYNNKEFRYGIIEIHFKYQPIENAKQFLKTVQNQISETGLIIQYFVSEEEKSEN